MVQIWHLNSELHFLNLCKNKIKLEDLYRPLCRPLNRAQEAVKKGLGPSYCHSTSRLMRFCVSLCVHNFNNVCARYKIK